jgi:hypothetical protein
MGRLADEIYVVGKAQDLMQVPTASLYQLVKLLLPAIGTSFALSSRECFIELQIVYRTRRGVERRGDL